MLAPGTRIGKRYLIEGLLGQGGMSNLYMARDVPNGNAVRVIKEMTARYPDPNEQAQAEALFMREAELLATLNHPNIPKVFDKFKFQGLFYLSMELVQGEDLGKIITKAGKPLAEVDVANYGSQMAAVLYYLHRQNPPIVFRDVKPSNIMICGDKVKLIDFGIARLFTPAKKGDTMRIGSPGYAPPEQYSGQSDPRSDMYALGVTLHHALTYHDPTESQTPFLIPPAKQLNPALSLEIVQIIERSTQLDPDKRYANMLDMRRDLQSVLRLHGIQTGASTPLQPMTMAGSSTPIQPAVSPSQPTTPQLATQGPILQPAQTAQNPMTPAGLPVSALTGPPPPTTPPPAKSTPSSGGMAGRLVSSLLKVAVVAGIGLGGWTLANQKQIKVPEPVQQFIQSMSSPVLPADPGQAALLMAQRGGPNESILTLCENSLKQQPSDAAVLLAYQNALLRQAKVADRQLDVLIPAGASAENLRRCVVVAQRVLSNRGLAYPVINLVEFDASSADGLQSAYLQLSSKSTTRAGDPAQRSLLVYTTKSANLKPSADAIPTFWAGRNLASSPTGIQTLNLADSPWSEWVTKSSQIEPDKLLWLSEKAPPTGSIKVSSTDALAKEAVKSLGKAKAIVADVSQFQAIQQLPIPIKLPTYLLSETSVQLPATIKGDSAWLALCASSEMSEYPVQGDAIRLSSQIFGDKSPMESSEAIDLFDALLWSCSGEQTRFYGMRLRRNESGKLIPNSPSFWAWTEGWRVKNTSGSGAQP